MTSPLRSNCCSFNWLDARGHGVAWPVRSELRDERVPSLFRQVKPSAAARPVLTALSEKVAPRVHDGEI